MMDAQRATKALNGVKNSGQSLDELFTAFSTYLTRSDRRPATVKGYLKDLRHFAKWFEVTYGEAWRPADTVAIEVQEYRAHQLQKNLAPSTINRRLNAIRHLLRLVGNDRNAALSTEVLSVKDVSTVSQAPKGLDRGEVVRLVREAQRYGHGYLQPRNYALVQLFLQTGIRLSEAAALKVGDVEIRERSGVLIVREGKGGKVRHIPLNATARKALADHLETRNDPHAGEPLFFSQKGGALSPRGIEGLIKELTQRAGLEDVTTHHLRHTFAYHYLEATQDLVGLQQILGHESLNTTARYTLQRPEDLERRVEALPYNIYAEQD